MLESVKTPGQYIHAGGMFSADSLDSRLTEVDLSVQKTSFVIMPHKIVPNDLSDTEATVRVRDLALWPCPASLRCPRSGGTRADRLTSPHGSSLRLVHGPWAPRQGGDAFCIVHKEFDSYLTAEGVFTGFGAEEAVHLRSRHDTNAQAVNLFNDASITWWQVRLSPPPPGGPPPRHTQRIQPPFSRSGPCGALTSWFPRVTQRFYTQTLRLRLLIRRCPAPR